MYTPSKSRATKLSVAISRSEWDWLPDLRYLESINTGVVPEIVIFELLDGSLS